MNKVVITINKFFDRKVTKYEIPMFMFFALILFTLEVISRFLGMNTGPLGLLYIYVSVVYEYLNEKRKNNPGL